MFFKTINLLIYSILSLKITEYLLSQSIESLINVCEYWESENISSIFGSLSLLKLMILIAPADKE